MTRLTYALRAGLQNPNPFNISAWYVSNGQGLGLKVYFDSKRGCECVGSLDEPQINPVVRDADWVKLTH